MSLGKLLMTSPVGELKNWDDLKKSIATGDILLCQTVGLFGAIEQLATSAPYTHVAMFIRGKNGDLMILESSRTDRNSGYKDMVTGKTDGPKVIEAEFYIHNYIENDMGVLTYRPLRMMCTNEPIEITDEREKRLNDLFDAILKKDIRYERNLLDLANSLFHVYAMDHTDPTSMFCSETVSTVLAILDVPLMNVPDKTIPRDFSQNDENIIDKEKNEEKGKDAVELGNEVTIVLVEGNETNDSNAGAKITADFPFSKIPIGPPFRTSRKTRESRTAPYRPRGGSSGSTDRRTTNDERFSKLVEILRSYYRDTPGQRFMARYIDDNYVSISDRRSNDIEEFKSILNSYSDSLIDQEYGPVDVNRVITTREYGEPVEVKKTDTLLSLAVMNDQHFEDMIRIDGTKSYVNILLDYKATRTAMLYGNTTYRPDILYVEDKPNGLIELEKKFGILDINQRIKRSTPGIPVFESDALIEAIYFRNTATMYSLLNDPSVDDTLAYKYVEDKILSGSTDDRWRSGRSILNFKRRERGIRRMRHALDRDNESIIRKLLEIDEIATVVDNMGGGVFEAFIRNRIYGKGPQPRIGNILWSWKRRNKEDGKEWYEEYWGSDDS